MPELKALFFLPCHWCCKVADEGRCQFIKLPVEPKNNLKGRFFAFLLVIHADVSFLC